VRREQLGALALALVVAACGRTKAPGGDDDDDTADAGDLGPDADVTGSASVTVTATGSGLPLDGVPVHFYGPDGAVLAETETDEDGLASAVIVPGSAVVALVPSIPLGASGIDARAVVGIAPGDEILLGGQRFPIGDVTPFTVHLPGNKAASSYVVQTPCGYFANAEPSVTVQFTEGCDPDPFAFLAVAWGKGPVATLAVADVSREDAEIVISDPWRAVEDLEVNLESIPTDVGQVFGGVFAAQVGTTGLPIDLTSDGTEDVDEDERLDLLAPGMLDHREVDLTFRPNQGVIGEQRLIVWTEDDAEELTLDASEALAPWVGIPYYDPASRTVGFSRTGDAPWDATYLHLQWSVETSPKTFQYGQLRVAFPPGATQVALPPFAGDLEDVLPPGAHINSAVLTTLESSAIDGWDDIRPRGLEPMFGEFARTLPAPSTTRIAHSPFEI
jgi:hypothetical protein